MARRKKETITHHCKDCIHHFDEHELSNITRLPFMCRCWLHRKLCRFLQKDSCEDYNRNDAEVREALDRLISDTDNDVATHFDEALAEIRKRLQ